MLRRAFVSAMALAMAMASAATAQVKLEYKFPEGTATTFKETVKAKQVLTLAGMDIETNSERTSSTTSKFGKREPDGTLRIGTTLDVLRGQFEIMGAQFAFDSSDPNVKIDNPELAFLTDLVKVVTGKEVTIVVDGKNKVKTVEGADQIAEAAKAAGPKVAEQIQDAKLTERYQHEFEQDHSSLPDILVREGETWERTEDDDLGQGQTLSFRRRFEYQGTVEKDGRKLDKIGIKALDIAYKMAPESKSPLKAQKSDLKVESSDGHMLFDREAGIVVERNDVSRIKGTIDFKINDQELPGKLDLTYEKSLAREPSK